MPGRSNRNLVIMCCVAACCMAGGCTTLYNPATGRTESYLISTPQEISMGRDMDVEVGKKMKILNNPSMQARLDRIGKKIASASDRQDLQYAFRVVDDKDYNAFAIPGGFIYVNSGLMSAATDDELACVLAHEAGHIAARHSIKKLQTTLGYQLLLGLTLGISGQQQMKQAVDVVFNLASLGYSRQDELLADSLGVRYARRAGFNPEGMVTFFRKLQNEGSNAPHTPVFLSSHPATEERIKHAQAEIDRP